MNGLLHASNFLAVTQWVVHHGYWVMLIAMFVEGPVVTAAAAFAVTLGYFDIWAVFVISILGDLIPDVVYYAIGYWGRITLVERFGSKVGLTPERMERMAKLLHDHAWKTMIALKMTPILPTTGLMVVGTTKMPIKKYVVISSVVILPKTILFMLVGYYFGQAYGTISKYIDNLTYLALIIVAIFFVFSYLYKKYSAKLGQKLEKF
ncbi:MAG TPA: VTT domain-containing protein [Candidatus Paceibacterota bacterium]|nr:VTT domain-containing protein [Candidatus Paceibacterota bacterium]